MKISPRWARFAPYAILLLAFFVVAGQTGQAAARVQADASLPEPYYAQVLAGYLAQGYQSPPGVEITQAGGKEFFKKLSRGA